MTPRATVPGRRVVLTGWLAYATSAFVVTASDEIRFVLTRTLPLGVLLSLFGVVIGVFGTDGPEPFTMLAMLLVPGAFIVPDVTGHLIGDDQISFGLFVLVQLAYYHVVLRVGAIVVRGGR